MSGNRRIGWFKITLFIIIALLFLKGVFMNCIFLDEKYSDRKACMGGEFMGAVQAGSNWAAQIIHDKMERKMERLEHSFSGVIQGSESPKESDNRQPHIPILEPNVTVQSGVLNLNPVVK